MDTPRNAGKEEISAKVSAPAGRSASRVGFLYLRFDEGLNVGEHTSPGGY
ncbi:MAG TPA: hypothetical protein VF316_00590 [Polyangiaceae bacterium]